MLDLPLSGVGCTQVREEPLGRAEKSWQGFPSRRRDERKGVELGLVQTKDTQRIQTDLGPGS